MGFIGRSTGDHGLQEEMVRRRGDHLGMVEQRREWWATLRVLCCKYGCEQEMKRVNIVQYAVCVSHEDTQLT